MKKIMPSFLLILYLFITFITLIWLSGVKLVFYTITDFINSVKYLSVTAVKDDSVIFYRQYSIDQIKLIAILGILLTCLVILLYKLISNKRKI